PLVQAWKNWNPENATEVVDPAGRSVRVSHYVESVEGDIVTFTETTSDIDGRFLWVDRASLRFFDLETLRVFLLDAGFAIDVQFGTRFGEPFTSEHPEIITIAWKAPK